MKNFRSRKKLNCSACFPLKKRSHSLSQILHNELRAKIISFSNLNNTTSQLAFANAVSARPKDVFLQYSKLLKTDMRENRLTLLSFFTNREILWIISSNDSALNFDHFCKLKNFS